MRKKKKSKKSVVKKDGGKKQSLTLFVDCFNRGMSWIEACAKVTEFRKENKWGYSVIEVKKLMAEAQKIVNEQYDKTKEHIISLHVERYNRDIELLINLPNPFEKDNDPDGSDAEEDGEEEYVKDLARVKSSLINSYYTALSTMFSKEKVMGMHSKNFQLHISNKLNLNIEQEEKKVAYNLSALSTDEKVDFLHLTLKTKKNEFEIGSVILKPKNDEQQTIDIEHEEIAEEVNIDKIKHEEQPIPEPVKNDVALLDISRKLEETFKRKAAEEYKKAGSKTVS